MTYLQAIVLGLIQGLGEFLPISSSAHLKTARWLFGWNITDDIAVDVALHAGTLVALLLFFRADILRLGRAFLRSLAERSVDGDPDRAVAWLVLIGSLPGALLGVLFEHRVEEALREPWTIGAAMIVFGLLLFLFDRYAAADRAMGSLTLRDALTIGLSQAAAIVPGVSRSGSTITAGRALGLDRDTAARYSFLLAAPIIFGASIHKLPQLIREGGFTAPLWVAITLAAVSGYLAIGVLLRYVRARSYLPFAVYRVAFGVFVIGAWLSGRGG